MGQEHPEPGASLVLLTVHHHCSQSPVNTPKLSATEPTCCPGSPKIQLLLMQLETCIYLRTISRLNCLRSCREPPAVHISWHPGAFQRVREPGWQEAAGSRGALLAPQLLLWTHNSSLEVWQRDSERQTPNLPESWNSLPTRVSAVKAMLSYQPPQLLH